MSVSGAVDGVLGRFVIGWAHDPDEAARRVELEVELDGRFVGSGEANLERGDLRAAGIGDGSHAFRIELPEPIEPGSEHVLAVRTLREGLVLSLANDCVVEFEDGVLGPPAVLRTEVLAPTTPAHGFEFDASFADAPALLGAGGWLFEPHDVQMMDRMLGRAPLSDKEIERQRGLFLRQRNRARELGVAYVVAILPDKASVYADRLPGETSPLSTSRAVELVSASLYDENGLDLLDLLPFLRHARRHGLLYPRTGAGLTWLGALHAYRAVAKELAKRLPIEPIALDSFALGPEVPVTTGLGNRERVVPVGGELVRVVADAAPIETEPDLAPGMLQATFAPLSPTLERRTGPGASLLECSRPHLAPGAVVVHHGGAARVASLLAEHFRSTLVAVAEQPPYEAIESAGSTIIVQLVSELSLCRD